MPDKDIILRGYREGDENQISHLFFNNFPETLEPEDICQTWLWQFQNGFSKSSGVSVADMEDEIVAHYAVMWFPMCCQGANIEGAISTATVTDVKARGKRLFTRLAEKVFKETEADGCKIVFGFPNSQSIKGFIKYLDWFELAKFPLLIKPINFSPFVMKFLKNGMLSSIFGSFLNLTYSVCLKLIGGWGDNRRIRIEPVMQGIPDEVDDIWESDFASDKIAIARTSAYLKWRYRDKPFGDYDSFSAVGCDNRIEGIMVASVAEKKGLKIVYVMEMLAVNDDQNVYKSFLNFLDRYAREQGADAVSMLCLPNHPCKRLFWRHGLIPVPRRMFPQDIHFCARANSEEVDKAYLADSKNWFITWGDLDIV